MNIFNVKGSISISLNLLLLAITLCTNYAIADINIFNVIDYGAAGDGNTDDTQAFLAAWKEACSVVNDTVTIVIPNGKTFLVYATNFSGPCNATNITITLNGTIIAPDGPGEWKAADVSTWLRFERVVGLNIYGNGFIDGRGKGWWDISCRDHPQLQGCGTLAPTMIRIDYCNEVNMSNIFITNSPQTHITVFGSTNVGFELLNITAPGDSPNTDGIHLQDSLNVSIYNSNIGVGDDCISIGDSTSAINISNINCGPGHGISIGSLGRQGNEVKVENITVKGVNFQGTTNGVRIKTWQVGRGQVRDVVFSTLNFTAVQNPIIIDQFYCDVPNSCNQTTTGVQISNVMYQNTIGTSESEVAINLNCTANVPCTNITLDNVTLSSVTPGKEAIAVCNNAFGFAQGTVVPNSCLH